MVKQIWVYGLIWTLFFGGVACAQEPGKPLPDDLGITLERPTGGFINLRIENNHFILYFLDEKLNLVEPVYPMAIVRYVVHDEYKRSVTVTLRQENGSPWLTASRYIRPQPRYRVTIQLSESTATEVSGNASSSGSYDYYKNYSSYEGNQSSQELESSDIKETYTNILLNQ
ncbi:MAG: hypothetical protein Tsb0018_05400 [Opitutales bacterium]|tara:strand:- start:3695 stop:4207 length:513 start_codon:yes stop_codon:yes gene_type:complete